MKCIVKNEENKRKFKFVMQAVMVLWCALMYLSDSDVTLPMPVINVIDFVRGACSGMWIAWLIFCAVKKENPFFGRCEK